MDQDNEEFVLPEDLQDVEVIYYSDAEGDEENTYDDEDSHYEQVEDLSKFTFTKHEKGVFTVDISPDEKHLVTGGEDDMAFIWDLETKEVIVTCTGHKDSVTHVGFSHNGKYVVTADMSGTIQVWNVSERNLAWSTEMEDLEWIQWHPIANVLVGGFHSGDIYVWQLPQGIFKVLPSHGHVSSCGKILPDGIRLVAGYGDGQVKLWDLKTTDLLWKKTCEEGITALNVNSNGTLLGIAPISELALMSDGRSVVYLKSNDNDEIEGILLCSELDVIVTGSISGEVCVWNISKHILRHKIDIHCAVTVLKLGRNGEIFIGGTDGVIYVCNIMAGTIRKVLTGHADDILDIAVPKQGNYIISSSDDSFVKIFDI